jgi:hypothetical protein
MEPWEAFDRHRRLAINKPNRVFFGDGSISLSEPDKEATEVSDLLLFVS